MAETKPAAKREKVALAVTLLLALVVLAAGAPAPAEAVALPILASPLELAGVHDQHQDTPGGELAAHLAADPRGPPTASTTDLAYPETRNRVSARSWPHHAGPEGELSRYLQQGYEQHSGWVVVESLDAPGRGPGTGLGPGAMWRGEGWARHFSESPDGIRLFEKARAYRARFPGSASAKKYRNFVTADVVVDGKSRLVHFKNTPKGLHSEERLITWVERMQARGHSVEVQRLFSERTPCGVSSANCLGKLADAFDPRPEVYFNIVHGPQ